MICEDKTVGRAPNTRVIGMVVMRPRVISIRVGCGRDCDAAEHVGVEELRSRRAILCSPLRALHVRCRTVCSQAAKTTERPFYHEFRRAADGLELDGAR